jgi:hypothetical protein
MAAAAGHAQDVPGAAPHKKHDGKRLINVKSNSAEPKSKARVFYNRKP